jgi:hypothetical protein
VAKLGSVVGGSDLPGVYFTGPVRERLFAIQQRIARTSSLVTLLTPESEALWRSCFPRTRTLLVPGAADATLPGLGRDPYPRRWPRRCLFAGNVYDRGSQPEAHETLTLKLDRLGQLLAARGIRLFVAGVGDTRALERKHVTVLGPVPYDACWGYLAFAGAGLVLALGAHKNHNESTKIYHYLRAGLPVVCESGFPNESLVTAAGLGFLVPNGDLEGLADRVGAALDSSWDRDAAVRFVLRGHTWDHRAETYERWLRSLGTAQEVSQASSGAAREA